jgi:hypothetical protein
VFLYDDIGSAITDQQTTDGITDFYLAPATYRAIVRADNSLGFENLQVSSGELTEASAAFGRLQVSSFDYHDNLIDTRVIVSASSGLAVVDVLAPDGRLSFYLAEGNYRVEVGADNSINMANILIEPGREWQAIAKFSRLRVNSIGEQRIPIDTAVALYDATGTRIAFNQTANGFTVFHLAGGIYHVDVQAAGTISLRNIRLSDSENRAIVAFFGRLEFISSDDTTVFVYDDLGAIAAEGSTSNRAAHFYLGGGTYRISTSPPTQEINNIVVLAGRVTSVGERVNRPPEITRISADPGLVGPGESATITVSAFDSDGDALTYAWSSNVGTVSGSGARVTYTPPNALGTYQVAVTVSDTLGRVASTSIVVSGGQLAVYTYGENGITINASVSVFDDAGIKITEGVTSSGEASFLLPVGGYRVDVKASNTITIDNLNVTPDRVEEAIAYFSRLRVNSYCENGIPLDAQISIYDQGRNKLADQQTSGGYTVFYLEEGIYRAEVRSAHTITLHNIILAQSTKRSATAVFGRLQFITADDATVVLFDDRNFRIATQSTSSGKTSFCLPGGTYRITTSSPPTEIDNILVVAGEVTTVGEVFNRSPVISDISANPTLIKAGESTTITISAFDRDGDPLAYSWSSTNNLGTISGSGSSVNFTAPDAGGVYEVKVIVSDGNTGTAEKKIVVSGGVLKVLSRQKDDAPVVSNVVLYDDTGSVISSQRSDGEILFRLVQGTYRVDVEGATGITIEDLLVATDRVTQAIANFGSLEVLSLGAGGAPIETSVTLFTQGGAEIATQRTSNGTTTFHLTDGIYRVEVLATNTISIDNIKISALRAQVIEIRGGTITTPGATTNEPPSIASVVVTQTEAQKFEISITVRDADGDRLSISYAPTGGATVQPEGTRATVIGDPPFSVRIVVSDDRGGQTEATVDIRAED